MDISLAEQTIVVTGGSKRLGRALVLALAQAGARVAFTYKSSAPEAQELLQLLSAQYPGRQFASYCLEVSDQAMVQELAEKVEVDFGRAHGLVNCAAIFRRTPFEAMTEADFDDHINANLKGPYLCCKAFGDHFLSQGGGAIVNFADIHGIHPLTHYVPYCVSKAGVIMLTKTLAKALAPTVRVNCLCPGTILEPSQAQGTAEPETAVLSRIPLRRMGTPEEIAQAVIFLLAGPSFITGTVLPVDGGQILN